MKTLLIQVGKTVNKHFMAGISDYVERINHYMPFEVVTIPELKNARNLSEEQQKQTEGELILKQLQPSDTVVLLDEPSRLCHRRPLWLLPCCLCPGQRTSVTLQDDILPSDDTPHLHRTGLPCLYHHQRRAVSSRVTVVTDCIQIPHQCHLTTHRLTRCELTVHPEITLVEVRLLTRPSSVIP